jgi:hypothetical protein
MVSLEMCTECASGAVVNLPLAALAAKRLHNFPVHQIRL